MKRALFVFILLSFITPAHAQLAFESSGLNNPPGLNIPSVNPYTDQNNFDVPHSYDSLDGGQTPVNVSRDTVIQEGSIPQETEASQETLFPETPETNQTQENTSSVETPSINTSQWNNLPSGSVNQDFDFDLNQYKPDLGL